MQIATLAASGLSIKAGGELVKTTTVGATELAWCSECGCHLYQTDSGNAGVRGVYPTTFHIESPDERCTPGVNSLLPDNLKPQAHANYASRTFEWEDALPKS